MKKVNKDQLHESGATKKSVRSVKLIGYTVVGAGVAIGVVYLFGGF